MISDLSDGVNQGDFFGEDFLDLLDDCDYFLLRNFNWSINIYWNLFVVLNRRQLLHYFDFFLNDLLNNLRNFNYFLNNSRNHYNLFYYFLHFNCSGYFNYLFYYLLNDLNFRFDTIIVVRYRIGVFFFDVDWNLFFDVDWVAYWYLNWSFMDNRYINFDFDGFVNFFDDLVNKRHLFYLINNFDNFFEDRFLYDSIN